MKDQRQHIHPYKSVAMYSCVKYYGFNQKILKQNCFNTKLSFGVAY